jgi:hypothetical protein
MLMAPAHAQAQRLRRDVAATTRGNGKGDKCGKDSDQDRNRDKPRFVAPPIGVRRIAYRKDINQMPAEIEQDAPGNFSERQLYCEELVL